jgi:hypothetical protein
MRAGSEKPGFAMATSPVAGKVPNLRHLHRHPRPGGYIFIICKEISNVKNI